MTEKRERGPRWYAGLTIFVVAVTLGLVTNLRQNAARERTDRVVCEIVNEGASGERDRIRAYTLEPPVTPAGVAQKRAAQDALARWEHRARDLGCPPESERS